MNVELLLFSIGIWRQLLGYRVFAVIFDSL